MSFREPTTIGRVPLLLASGAADRFGLDPEALLREAGFSAVELRDADARIPSSKVRQLWAQIVQRVPDPAVGVLLAEGRAPRELGLIAYTMQMAETLGEALHRLQRYIHVLGEGLEFAVHRSAGRAEIVLERAFPAEPARAPEEFRLALLLAAI